MLKLYNFFLFRLLCLDPTNYFLFRVPGAYKYQSARAYEASQGVVIIFSQTRNWEAGEVKTKKKFAFSLFGLFLQSGVATAYYVSPKRRVCKIRLLRTNFSHIFFHYI